MDGFIHVVRVFEDENVPHVRETIDPLRDIQAMDSELMLNDLIAVERKLEHLAEEKKKGAGRDKAVIERELCSLPASTKRWPMKHPCAILSERRRDEDALGFWLLEPETHFDRAQLSEGQKEPEISLYPQALQTCSVARKARSGYCPALSRRSGAFSG
jgi:hypothetical protein